MEELVTDFVMTLKTDYNYTSAEFLFLLGKYLGKIFLCFTANGVPIFVQLWLTAQFCNQLKTKGTACTLIL